MKLLENNKYDYRLKSSNFDSINWDKLKNKNILITGSTGMIGSFLIDLIMLKNQTLSLNCRILALGRCKEKAFNRFNSYWNNNLFIFFEQDLNDPININEHEISYIIHAASNTHPKAYSSDPIGTITTNVIATKNLLDIAVIKKTKRFIFLSSVEIYGENRGDIEKFNEDYCGYINCNTLRAGYPESKRVGEALCQAYIKQKNLDIVIPRLSRVYGPTMLLTDSKALSQFILKAVNDEDIVLKSKGNQFYSYIYVSDAANSILKLMLDGECGVAYNVANPESDVTLSTLSNKIASLVGKRVIFELPDDNEKKGYSTATKALLDITSISNLGWHPKVSLDEGLSETIEILRLLNNKVDKLGERLHK